MKNILKNINICIILIFIFLNQNMQGQQLMQSSLINETYGVFNPAYISNSTKMYLDVFVRQQWLGFGGAPKTGYINFEMPMIDYAMSIGGTAFFDQVGPVKKLGINGSYAYKIEQIFSKASQLSFGINAGIHTYRYNGSDAIVNKENDPLVLAANSSAIFPTINLGMYYDSNNKGYRYGNSLIFGLSFQQIYQTNVLISEANQQRTRHMNVLFGTKLNGRDSYVQPTLMVNYGGPAVNFLLGLKYEMVDRFWMGMGYSNVNDLAFQAGYIFEGIGGNKYANLRVGLQGGVPISDRIKDFGPSLEFFTRYEIDMD